MYRELICFDLDNTLFDHEAAFEKAIMSSYQLLIKDLQLKNPPPPDKWFQRFKQNSDRYWMWFEEGARTKVQYRRDRFRSTMESFNLPSNDKLSDDFHERYDRTILDFITLYPGVSELFEFLKSKDVTLGIITNGNLDLQENKAKKLKLYRWISNDQMWISEQYKPKPNRRMFDLARERIQDQNTKPLFVGDSWSHDVVGSVRAGWDAIFLNSRNETPSTAESIIATCQSFEEVSDVIKSQFA